MRRFSSKRWIVTDPELLRCLIEMQAEFESHRLVVGLAPPRRPMNEGGMIRALFDQNTKWYRELCNRHACCRMKKVRHRRKFDTKIKRANVSRVLERLIQQLPTRSKYASEIIDAAITHREKTSIQKPTSKRLRYG